MTSLFDDKISSIIADWTIKLVLISIITDYEAELRNKTIYLLYYTS